MDQEVDKPSWSLIGCLKHKMFALEVTCSNTIQTLQQRRGGVEEWEKSGKKEEDEEDDKRMVEGGD